MTAAEFFAKFKQEEQAKIDFVRTRRTTLLSSIKKEFYQFVEVFEYNVIQLQELSYDKILKRIIEIFSELQIEHNNIELTLSSACELFGLHQYKTKISFIVELARELENSLSKEPFGTITITNYASYNSYSIKLNEYIEIVTKALLHFFVVLNNEELQEIKNNNIQISASVFFDRAKSYEIKEDYIIKFNAIRSSKDTSDIAKLINIIHESDNLCSKCEFKKSDACETCLLVLDSPLERKLFVEFKKAKISFQPQYALDRNGNQISIEGKNYSDAKNNFKDVLTIVDFYIERKGVRFCVYTDGHTYHERTPEQAQRDRNIDRKLQEFGFKVLRYTGKEVNEDSAKIVSDILDWKKNKNHDGFDADDLPF